ncbi:GNAT family N-acetyltransferase [Aquimarina sp. 2201CG5-10]|uniref:GNAT family N-acetyltransferase n=1 Tax=Aquimarina callyspongiae TaxID=3098150 RepID=UPI002AB52CE5|nr:GNAT family N-acetyltransferase [Aquimarina sp. 2201CG5-10]MDY8136178.1 GNAT family N-acetyltransferase [Aquimarina sp. 2201CG5-10]
MIRAYKISDKDQLVEIFKLNTPKYFDVKEVHDFITYLDQKKETYLTIEVDNKIVGGTGYYVNKNDNSGRITWIFFDPEYSGKGLGKQSVKRCLELLSEDDRVEKFVVTTSQLVYRFFEKFGFVITKTKKDYWGEGLDLYEMEMTR